MSLGLYQLKTSALCLALGAGLSLQAAAQNQNKLPSSSKQASAGIAPQAPLNAQERLDAIRQSLIDASLQGPTKVSTTTWVDPQGSLRENSTFKNNLDVSGVKVLGFERDENGQAKARFQYQNGKDAQNTASKNNARRQTETGLQGAIQKFRQLMTQTMGQRVGVGSDDALAQAGSACAIKVGANMNHVIDLDVHVAPHTPQVLMQTLLPQIQSQWVQGNAQNGKNNAWRAVNALPAASMSKNMSAYERALISSRPDTLPWQALIKISSEPVSASSFETYLGAQSTAAVLSLEFQLLGADGQNAQFKDSAKINIETERTAWSAARLSAASIANIHEQLQSWRNDAEDWLNCQSFNPAVTAATGQQIEINAGAMAGVRKGDEWLVANPARFPAELMSREGAPQTLLATVQSVTPFGSKLMVVAGPSQAVQPNWRAWPTEVLVKEPSIAPTPNNNAPAKRPAKSTVGANANYDLSHY